MLVAGGFLVFMGAGFLYFCTRYFLAEGKSRRQGIQVVARVVGEETRTRTRPGTDAFTSSDTRETGTYSFPVVEFQLADGRTWRAGTKVNAPSPKPVGTPMPIRYLPDDPNEVWPVTNPLGWIVKVLLAIGVALLAGGAVLLAFGAGVL